jgi:hypothetical protein
MAINLSIPLNGISAATQKLNQASHRIATMTLPSSDDLPGKSVSLSDVAADMVQINQAKFMVEANLKVISTQQELDRDAINLFA